LAAEGTKLAGLYAGNPQRTTDRPTVERLLKAFEDIILTIIEGSQQTARYVTALSPLQQRILELSDFSAVLYTLKNDTLNQQHLENQCIRGNMLQWRPRKV
jgi:hypothetical protein